jgi:hypothetical protein
MTLNKIEWRKKYRWPTLTNLLKIHNQPKKEYDHTKKEASKLNQKEGGELMSMLTPKNIQHKEAREDIRLQKLLRLWGQGAFMDE